MARELGFVAKEEVGHGNGHNMSRACTSCPCVLKTYNWGLKVRKGAEHGQDIGVCG